jgi:dipeptidyl aminopeptidase/acylaminoacyl peptidase
MVWKLFVLLSQLLASLLFLLSCTPQPPTPIQPLLYFYRFDPPAFVELNENFAPGREILFSVPLNCSLFDVFPAPVGKYLLVELSCPNGQMVLFLDTDSGSTTQPIADVDSHFLAWAYDGDSAYLKIDSFGDPRVVRVSSEGRRRKTEITGLTYDLATRPGSDDFVFSFSRGLGYGSEMTLSQNNDRDFQQLYVDRLNYLSFARFSPDGNHIAWITIPDSSTPFTVGELWVMDADGSNARKLADVDAGHGYAANWSPDGEWIAFVKRENAAEKDADRSSEALVSNIYLVEEKTGVLRQVTSFTRGGGETPHWSPDGNMLAFNIVLDGRMSVQIADLRSGEIRSLGSEPACCPAWMRK